MNLRALRTLSRLAEEPSFAQVAAELNQPVSTVSMQMRTLEEALGARLFDRAFRPPRLTPIGRAVARQAAAVVREEEALEALVSSAGGLKGSYRVGFVLTASVRLLPGFLARARDAAPDAAFEIETGLTEHLQEGVLRGRLDAAVVTRGDPLPAGLASRTLLSEEIVLAVPPGVDDPARRLTFFHFMPETGIGQLIARELPRCRFPPRTRITLDGVEAIVECVRAGIGYTALPRPDVVRYAGDDLALHQFADDGPLMRDLALLTRSGSATDRAAETLAGLLLGS